MFTKQAAEICGIKPGGRYDTIVVGAGPAGIGAAIASARRGLRTLLIESGGYAGGVATRCCVPLYFGFDSGGVQLTAGLSEEFVRRMDEIGAASFMVNNDCAMPEFSRIGGRPITGKVQMKPEHMKLMLRRMLEESGVECLFYARFVDAVNDNGRVASIIVSCLEGARLYEADTFIDCTGDALLCHAADPKSVVKYGDEFSMHKSMFFFVGGVTPFDGRYNRQLYKELYEKGRVPGNVWPSFGHSVQLTPGVVQIAVCFATGDAVSSADMSRMDRELRENVFEIVEFLRREMPGFKDCYLLDTGESVGVRAGQGIVGKESVDYDSLYTGCDDTVALTILSYGAHSNKKHEWLSAWADSRPGVGRVPMGALIPSALKNVLAAGRCISTDPKYIGVFRMMNTCMTLGEAAGLMAYAAKKHGISVCDVNYDMLLPLLRENSFIL